MISSTSLCSSTESLRPSKLIAILASPKNLEDSENFAAIILFSSSKSKVSSRITTIPYLLPLIITELFIGTSHLLVSDRAIVETSTVIHNIF